jgi:hypothetical protein
MLYETDRTTTLVLVPHGLQPRLLRILCTLYLWRALQLYYTCGMHLWLQYFMRPVGVRGPRVVLALGYSPVAKI